MLELKNNPAGNFFLLAGPCVIEGEEMAMRIAERVVNITEKLQIPYVFKGSYRKANRSRPRPQETSAVLSGWLFPPRRKIPACTDTAR